MEFAADPSAERRFSRIRRVAGHIFPSLDPVVKSEKFWDSSIGRWGVARTRQSGRVTESYPGLAPSTIIIPTAEWTNPYGPEDFKRWEEQGVIPEAPPEPKVISRPEE